MSKRTVYIAGVVFLISFICGTYAFAIWVSPYFFQTASKNAAQVSQLMYASSQLLYGTVTGFDSSSNTMTITTLNRFDGGAMTEMRIKIEPSAYVARQQLQQGTDGSYVSLSEKIVSPVSAIRTGDRVALTLSRMSDNALATSYLLFGNPL